MGGDGHPFSNSKNILFANFITDISASTRKKDGTTRAPSLLIHLKICLIIPERFQQQY
ncbi:hypothetical protein PAXY110619_06810 [Paenibacillus xylanexedens]|uniref:Uncharacterized protein n=1 Tax=Paenibacillus xylanexedens TaxID=528191 RepID=A0ABS4RW95_PAEXY|nr:hypothetical protein [Paenibacillus xylanexedens]